MRDRNRILQIVRKAICGLLPLCVANVVAERVAEELCREMETLKGNGRNVKFEMRTEK